MPPKKEDKTSTGHADSQEFSVSRFNFARSVLAFILPVLLCFSLFMSGLLHYQQSHQIELFNKMTAIYVLFISFSLITALKAIVSVKRVKIVPEGIEISNLFWREKLNWSQLKALEAPKNLNFAWLKTEKSFYLFVKRELQHYIALETLIGQYLPIKRGED